MSKRIRQRQKRLSEDEIEQLVAAYRAGLTVYQLAKQFGCHRTTVSGCLKAGGVRMRRTPPSEEQTEEAARLYESGLSCAQVGHKIGCHPDTLRSRLRERGVVIRGPHDRRGAVLSRSGAEVAVSYDEHGITRATGAATDAHTNGTLAHHTA